MMMRTFNEFLQLKHHVEEKLQSFLTLIHTPYFWIVTNKQAPF